MCSLLLKRAIRWTNNRFAVIGGTMTLMWHNFTNIQTLKCYAKYRYWINVRWESRCRPFRGLLVRLWWQNILFSFGTLQKTVSDKDMNFSRPRWPTMICNWPIQTWLLIRCKLIYRILVIFISTDHTTAAQFGVWISLVLEERLLRL